MDGHLAPASLDDGPVDVWWADLAEFTGENEMFRDLLSADERARADRFHREVDQRSFVIARGLLRRILARELGVEPRGLAFRYGPYGKPYLMGAAGETLHFSVAHSQGRALYALTRGQGRAIGVDVERVSARGSETTIVQQFFAPEEAVALVSLPPTMRRAAFFTLWTLKEAYLKATGTGLSEPLNRFAVRLDPDTASWRLYPEGSSQPDDRWTLCSLPCGSGYVAAVVVAGPIVRLTIRHWPDPPSGD